MNKYVNIKLLEDIAIDGEHQAKGSTVEVPLIDAHEIVGSGRGEYVNKDDANLNSEAGDPDTRVKVTARGTVVEKITPAKKVEDTYEEIDPKAAMKAAREADKKASKAEQDALETKKKATSK